MFANVCRRTIPTVHPRASFYTLLHRKPSLSYTCTDALHFPFRLSPRRFAARAPPSTNLKSLKTPRNQHSASARTPIIHRYHSTDSTTFADSPAPTGLSSSCVEDLIARERESPGPEPNYGLVVGGYETFSSKGLVEKFEFKNGGVLDEISLAYETWGTLNAQKDNVVLLHTGLSASSHAKSHSGNPAPGWWENYIGPNLALDTNKFFVICSNVLGGCNGSLGPSSINPATSKPFAMDFPIVSLEDMVKAQFLLLDSLGIENVYASVGSSMGGMQSLMAAAMFPKRVGRVVSISATARAYPQSIAFRYLQRRVLMSDPHWNRGNYYDGKFPEIGMKHAREIGMVTYRSGPEWDKRFGRRTIHGQDAAKSLCPTFLIESYLDHQGDRFCFEYDPNSLLYISKAMDMFDMSVDGDFEGGLGRVVCPALVIGVNSDILFPVWQQREIAKVLRAQKRPVTYFEIDSEFGHDTFLLDPSIGSAVQGHLASTSSVWTQS